MSLSSHNNNQSFDAGAIPVRTVFVPTASSATYSASVNDIIPAATPTDVFCLVGSATKTILITKVEVTPTASANGSLDFYVYKRTTANSNGTFTNASIALHDSNNPAPTAVAKLYSANPSALGTGVLVRAVRNTLASKTPSGIPVTSWIEEFGAYNQQPVVLRGVNQSLCINMAGQTLPTGTEIYFTFEWIEI